MTDHARAMRDPRAAVPSRRARRAVALVVIAALLGTLSLTPRPAHALNTAETVGVVLGALAGYVLLVVIATAAVYGTKRKKPVKPAVAEELTEPRRAATDGLRFAPECGTRAGQLPIFCW